jgi:regulatory protein
MRSQSLRSPGGRKPLDDKYAGDPKAAQNAAVALLARRDFSIAELRRKLKERGYLPSAIEPALADLESGRVIDDKRYGENVVAARARRGQGPARIRSELRRAGVDPEVVQTTMDRAREDGPDFLALARATRARKFGREIPKDRKERARQARFLQYRGFSNDHIRAVLEGDPELDSESDASGEPDHS